MCLHALACSPGQALDGPMRYTTVGGTRCVPEVWLRLERRRRGVVALTAALALLIPGAVAADVPDEPPSPTDPTLTVPPVTQPAPEPTPPPQSSITITLPPVRGQATKQLPSLNDTRLQEPPAASPTDGTGQPDPAPDARSAVTSPRPSSSRGGRRDSSPEQARPASSRAETTKHRAKARGRRIANKRAAVLRSRRAADTAAEARAAAARAGFGRQQPDGDTFLPPVAPPNVTLTTEAPSMPIAALATIMVGVLLLAGAALVPGRVLAQFAGEAGTGIRLGAAAVGLSLLVGTLVTLLSSA